MKIPLGLSSLNQLDMGKIDHAFNHELKHVVKDCADRPLDTTPRKVVLTMTVTPDPSDGVCDMVGCEFEVHSSVPKRRSRKYQLHAHANGSILVNPESPDDVAQGTLDELDTPAVRKSQNK